MTNLYHKIPCPLCGGKHLVDNRLCPHCGGDGFVPVLYALRGGKSLGEMVVDKVLSAIGRGLVEGIKAERKYLNSLKRS